MATSPDPRDPFDRLRESLRVALADQPLLLHVSTSRPEERRLWRACELATFAEYRLGGIPDPWSLTDEAIEDWSRLSLARGERIGDPADLSDYLPYWIMRDGRCLGTLAVALRDSGWGEHFLWVASLYLFREERRQGHAGLVMDVLDEIAGRLGLGGIRLETDWTWQGALHFYLNRGFWVANWKHSLSLVRYRADPRYEIRERAQGLDFLLHRDDSIGAAPACLISAGRDGDRLIWEDQRESESADNAFVEPLGSVASTFALCLAVRGWPLIRGPNEWEQRHRWCDVGMPEGLADKITVFEAYARHCRFRVATPRIPGLIYPAWDEL